MFKTLLFMMMSLVFSGCPGDGGNLLEQIKENWLKYGACTLDKADMSEDRIQANRSHQEEAKKEYPERIKRIDEDCTKEEIAKIASISKCTVNECKDLPPKGFKGEKDTEKIFTGCIAKENAAISAKCMESAGFGMAER